MPAKTSVRGSGTIVKGDLAPRLVTYGDRVLMRLDSSVIHKASEIPAPGGNRSSIKVSFSNERWNLSGNSHTYLFDYKWQMFGRAPIRNDPAP